MNLSSKNIVIFASGNGSNALNIIKYFQNRRDVDVKAVFCNNPKAKVIEKARHENIEVVIFNKKQLQETDFVLDKLLELSTDLIVLAGFLLKVPEPIVQKYPQRIINIHPSLLPKYGGRGMYGDHVHRNVLENKESETGISIHYVNAIYDDGQILAQFKTPIDKNETLDSLKAKIKNLEQKHFPETIDKVINKS